MSIYESKTSISKPSPDQFDIFLPWACNQYCLTERICIAKTIIPEYIGQQAARSSRHHTSSAKALKSRMDYASTSSYHALTETSVDEDQKCIHINTIYDHQFNLIEIRFEKSNPKLPTKIFGIIELILPFYPHLTAITIRSGLSYNVLIELRKIILARNITDICLDDTNVGNYHWLLDQPSSLRQLSLSRCNIDDVNIKDIADMLVYPLPASGSLCILNLASNKITDVGATYLSNALRSNRHLVFLSLSNNKIHDDGAIAILNSLTYFEMTPEEIFETKTRYLEYLKTKKAATTYVPEKILKEKSSMRQKQDSKEKTKKVVIAKKSKLNDVEFQIYKVFDDPFSSNNTVVVNKKIYATGNTKLAYLNLAYNNITFLVLSKILEVVKHQSSDVTGLVNINIDGNNLPQLCLELLQINGLLDNKLEMCQKSVLALHASKRHIPYK